MLYNQITTKRNQWLQSDDCAVCDLIKYIRANGSLRDTQVEAIETYLFLKIQGQNKPLWQLFSEGFFTDKSDLERLDINQTAREYLKQHGDAHALFDFAQQKIGKNTGVPEIEKAIKANPDSLDYKKIIKSIFYNVNYADYLMSLPMGAGKTYLMAAFIYLDLYFAQNEPDNKIFAHNFLVLIPSGLKSSIAPSLRTIAKFDPSWILPEPTASDLKKLLKFEILDEQKTGKKSNKARNPNAQKVSACLPNPFGQVFVVNAEKVILESLKFNDQMKLELDDEKVDTTNDLKYLFGQIPNMSILIDEVHHAATDDIKLRQAVNYWHDKGNITTVLGFSGTPNLSSAEMIPVGNYSFRSNQITNTVYYYPLVKAIEKFLKKPSVKVGRNLDRYQIIRQGIADFDELYKNKIYGAGTIPKLVIYCSNIEVLEEEIYPFLTGELKINPDEILRFHRGNKTHPQPEGSELEFRSLDLPVSRKRYILLVQVGKEGWDCPSLTGVILSQKGDSPQNMVLQTSCRCLRQVDKDKDETAIIWLNNDNAEILNKQLKQEQNTSIDELNYLNRNGNSETVERHSRMDFLDLPKVDFYQMKVTYQSIDQEYTPNTKTKLDNLLANIDELKTPALIYSSEIDNMNDATINAINESGFNYAGFNQWIFDIARESYGLISEKDLRKFNNELKSIFEKITYKKNEQLFFNELYDLYNIQSKIRSAFSAKRELQTKDEIIPQQAELLITEQLKEVENNDKLYPNKTDTTKILELDNKNASVEIDMADVEKAYKLMKETFEQQGMEKFVMDYEKYRSNYDYSLPVQSKNNSFHYLPYNFGGGGSSGFELQMIKNVLQLADFKNMGLEIYYNGERGLTEFVINCFAREGKYWKNIGRYTTDFLIVKRTEKNRFHKIMLLETKGALYSNDKIFQLKKHFVETEFLKINNEQFGYRRFDFLLLEDNKKIEDNIAKINNKINEFF
ncbi:MAG: DEAD/DEAH box helicase family protein [Planctomycetaceae bacterium]|jgi:hypothetical protein|nr:DEAD/DEAH box helicase family protein [Planctomycetaceae bacterium]